MFDFKLVLYKDEIINGDKAHKFLEEFAGNSYFNLFGKRYCVIDTEETYLWDYKQERRRDIIVIRARRLIPTE